MNSTTRGQIAGAAMRRKNNLRKARELFAQKWVADSARLQLICYHVREARRANHRMISWRQFAKAGA